MDDSSWPEFLDLLDSNPNAAWACLYESAESVLRSHPPPAMLKILRLRGDKEFGDLYFEFITHCCKDDFRVLRQYKDEGKPFRSWLYRVALHFFIDLWRGIKGDPPMQTLDETGERDLKYKGPGADTELARKEELAILEKMIERTDLYCRVLVVLRANGYSPQEIAILLGCPHQNKKVSDKLRYCQTKLARMMNDQGYDWSFFTEE